MEYKLITATSQSFESQINELAKQGWLVQGGVNMIQGTKFMTYSALMYKPLKQQLND